MSKHLLTVHLKLSKKYAHVGFPYQKFDGRYLIGETLIAECNIEKCVDTSHGCQPIQSIQQNYTITYRTLSHNCSPMANPNPLLTVSSLQPRQLHHDPLAILPLSRRKIVQYKLGKRHNMRQGKQNPLAFCLKGTVSSSGPIRRTPTTHSRIATRPLISGQKIETHYRHHSQTNYHQFLVQAAVDDTQANRGRDSRQFSRMRSLQGRSVITKHNLQNQQIRTSTICQRDRPTFFNKLQNREPTATKLRNLASTRASRDNLSRKEEALAPWASLIIDEEHYF